MRQASIAMPEKQMQARIAKLGQSKPFIIGSLVESRRKCGVKSCACANGGDLHPAWILTKNSGGKTKSVYVPVGMVPEVGKWTKEYKKVKELLKAIDAVGERIIAASKQRKKALARKSGEVK